MAQSTANLKAVGLNYSPNQLSLPDGSLTQADDIIIKRDNIVESRRGVRRYSETLGVANVTPKQLIEYKNRILAHYSDKLSFDTGTFDTDNRAIFNDFAGSYNETQDGLRIKSIEANKNLYFTTSEGIKKISAASAADFTTASGFIQPAGAVKALDITTELVVTQGQISGFLPPDSAVAYRAVWGYKDANLNLILGTPSNSSIVNNFYSNLIAMDLNALTDMLDKLDQAGSIIDNGDYANNYYSPLNSTGLTLQNNILALARELDTDLFYANTTGGQSLTVSTIALTDNIVTITFSSGDPTQFFLLNDSIELKNLDYSGSAFADVNGTHKIDQSVTTTTISFTFTHADIVSGTPTTCDIYSNNYRNIINTGDDTFTTPLSTLVLSTPPTAGETATIGDTLTRISNRLKSEPSGTISPTLQSTYVTPFTMTQAANAQVDITIPTDITPAYFVQVYRSRIFTATDTQTLGSTGGIPVVPDDELRLVYEGVPTPAEIAAGVKIFFDESPDSLVQNNTNLYTNPSTGEGIQNANEPPPFAKDINFFKNVTFYSNTRTKHVIPTFQLLGLSNITSGDKITITNSSGSDTYTFVTGAATTRDITYTAGSTITSGQYYYLHSGVDDRLIVFWQRVDGIGTQPTVSGAFQYVVVDVLSTDTDVEVATKNKSAINIDIFDFTATDNTLPVVSVANSKEGITTSDSAGTSPFTITVTQNGNGEDAASKQVLLSSLVSAAQAIEETAVSLVRVINKQSDSVVSAYYVSSDTTPPGQMTLQLKNLDDDPFYVLGSSSGIGSSFNPDISPDNTDITSISVGNPTIVTFSNPHTFQNGDTIIISGSNSTPLIDGEHTVTRIDSTHISLPINVTVAGTSGVWSLPSDTVVSTNDVRPNRIYYSKVNQPEAVPLLNYFDISAQDKDILRIFPLRDSLFAFKQDGTYRISGEVAPFVVALLDSSCILAAPDSVAVSNNIVYSWTTKGITPLTETGATSEVSRPIDTAIYTLSSNVYPNFSTLTWGVGYDSDNSYTVYTNSDPADEAATIGFRYCTLTNTWTNIQRSETCGIVSPSQDLLFMGSGTSNIVDRERKQFLRTDYADDDFPITLGGNALSPNGLVIQFTSVDNIQEGSVITQEQILTIYQYNSLLNQLDTDPTLQKNYFSTLEAVSGDNMRTKIVALAQKLDSDPGTNFKDYFSRIDNKTGTISSNSIDNPTIVTASAPTGLIQGRLITIAGTENGSIPSIKGTYQVSSTGTFGTSTTFTVPVDVLTAGSTGLTFSTAVNLNEFLDVQACYNDIIERLNADTGVTYNSYMQVTNTTLFEAVVLSVDIVKKKATLNLPLQWIVGDMRVYEPINCEWTYGPSVFGDPLTTKQVFDATVMMKDRALTEFTLSFASDLFPEFTDIKFEGQGNGIFGHYSDPGFGYSYFGGAGNSAPFRTYIPMNAQRCRYIITKINHKVAREIWILYGVTLTGKTGVSFRGYR